MMAQGLFAVAPATVNRIIKRPLTQAEQTLAMGYFRSLQNGLRALAIVSLVFFVTNTFLLSDIIMDWSVSFALTLVMLIVGAVALGMSLNALVIRKRMSDTLREGTVIEVQAPAYRNRTARNIPSWTVGPLSMIATPELAGMVQEGAQVNVSCIPRMRIVLSVNNIGLRRGAKMTCPPNLEAMAVPVEALQPAFAPPVPLQTQMAPPAAVWPQPAPVPMQVQPVPSVPVQYQPPPPMPMQSQPVPPIPMQPHAAPPVPRSSPAGPVQCPRCGYSNPPATRFCGQCGTNIG